MIQRNKEEISKLNLQIEDAIENYPNTQNILRAFQNVLLAKKRLVEGEISVDVDVSNVSTNRLEECVPVCRQIQLFSSDEPWEKVSFSLIPPIMTGFPALAKEMKKIEEAIKNEVFEFTEYFTSFPELKNDIVLKWASMTGIRPEVFQFFLINILKPVLGAKAKKAIPILGEFTWDKGFCPFCGGFPEIAVIKDKITERWLHCSCCGHQWRYNRIVCPYCGYEAKEEGSTYFFVEGKDQECAFVCDQCNRYLITLRRIRDTHELNPDIVSMKLCHLDALMQEKGFSPVAITEWNVFEPEVQ
ncbi:MAG: formate dehydrogenase accessory protein FdhE [Syntrophales bacterium]|jgi:FdhE protein|nr:formate dehydrogenase accessory protein FdhE [Syntrophales bacterium]MDY0044327.1 formate dehydrogenase accessory protein FdhE [Syntrophales bacterium]